MKNQVVRRPTKGALAAAAAEHRVQDVLRGRQVSEGLIKEYLTASGDLNTYGFRHNMPSAQWARDVWSSFQSFLEWIDESAAQARVAERRAYGLPRP